MINSLRSLSRTPFLVIPNVTFELAKGILNGLNGVGVDEKRSLFEDRESKLYAEGNVDHIYTAWLREMAEQDRTELARARDSDFGLPPVSHSLGYVTSDVSSFLFSLEEVDTNVGLISQSCLESVTISLTLPFPSLRFQTLSAHRCQIQRTIPR